MKENDFEINLAAINEAFNNKTLEYRINGFAYACKMKNIGIVKNGGVLFSSSKKQEDTNYFIATSEISDKTYGDGISISGNYGNLVFTFTNYPGKKNLDKKVVEIPFSISLIKPVDKDIYYLNIDTHNDIQDRFEIIKYRELKNDTVCSKICFYANVFDFSKILKLIKSFVYNPKLVFNTYNEIEKNKIAVFTNSDLSKGIMQDEKLDKPVSKMTKIYKKAMDV